MSTDPKAIYRTQLAKACFQMLVLKEGRTRDIAADPAKNQPAYPAKATRDACAQEAFNYADSFLEACSKQGAKPWEEEQ